MNALFMTERLPEDYYPGRFTITGPGLTCLGRRFGILAFSARYGHSGSGLGKLLEDLPLDTPVRNIVDNYIEALELDDGEHAEHRVNIVTYCRQDAMRTRTHEFHEDLFDAEKLTGAFGTMRNAKAWQMRFTYKNQVDMISPDLI